MSKVIFQAIKTDSGIVTFNLDKDSDYRDVIEAFKLFFNETTINKTLKDLYDTAVNELIAEKLEESQRIIDEMKGKLEDMDVNSLYPPVDFFGVVKS